MAEEDEQRAPVGGAGEGRHPLPVLINVFHRSIEGIRELVALAAPALAEPSELPDVFKVLADRMTPDQRKAVGILLFSWENGTRPDELAEGAGTGEELSLDALVELAREGDVTSAQVQAAVAEHFVTPDEQALLGVVATRWSERRTTPAKLNLLRDSMLVTGVAAYETLLAGVFTHQMYANPGLLDQETPEFSLKQLLEFGSIEDARHHSIERRVDKFMRDAPEKWKKWLADKAGIDIDAMAIDAAVFDELFLRRNIIVHNGGLVSREYIERSGSSPKDVPLGTRLPVSTEYLETALDELTIVGVGIAAAAWAKWFSDELPYVQKQLERTTYALLEAERNRACRQLSKIALELPVAGWSAEAIRVNQWIATKEQEGVDAIRDEVGAWDVTALSGEFTLARDALLDDCDAVFKGLPPLLEQGKVNALFLAEWPLLRSVRTDPRYAELVDAGEAAAAELAPNLDEAEDEDFGLD